MKSPIRPFDERARELDEMRARKQRRIATLERIMRRLTEEIRAENVAIRQLLRGPTKMKSLIVAVLLFAFSVLMVMVIIAFQRQGAKLECDRASTPTRSIPRITV